MDFETLYTTLEKMAAGKKLSGYNGAPVTGELEITDARPGIISVTAGSDGIVLSRSRLSAPNFSAAMTMQTAADLISGRLHPMSAFVSGAVRVKGNPAQLMALMRNLR